MTGPGATGAGGARHEGTARILLVGMMGAGKTTAGRRLAHRLGWNFLDSDAEVEKATGMTVPALFDRDGEAAFRRIEAEALARVCSATDPAVISVGGGAVLRPENRALLRASGRVIWLRARPATLVAPIGSGAGRPLLEREDNPTAALEALDSVRRPLYAEVAHETIDVDDLSPDGVGEQIVARVGSKAAT
jgi:shikimate kinase